MHPKSIPLPILAAVLLTALVSPAQARDVERGVESIDAVLHLRDGTNGYIVVRECEDCKRLRLKIDANTTAFASNKPIPVGETPREARSAITVIYDPESMTAKRIRWAE